MDRTKGIGGSDIAPLANYYKGLKINTYGRTAYDIYQEKIGEVEQRGEDTDAQHFGKVMEEVIARSYSRETMLDLKNADLEIIHPKHPYLIGHIDRWIVSGGALKILECKTAQHWVACSKWGEEGSDDIPEEYLSQVYFYSMITKLPVDVALYSGQFPVKIYPCAREKNLEKEIEDMAVTFWNEHVLKRNPPKIKTRTDVVKYAPEPDPAKVAILSQQLRDLVEKRKSLSLKEKEIDAEKERLNVLIAIQMGDASKVLGDNGKTLVTYKTTARKQFLTEKFKKENVELYQQYTTLNETKKVVRVW